VRLEGARLKILMTRLVRANHGATAALIAGRTLSGMVDQKYLVTLMPPSRAIQQVLAATVEVRGNHLVFVDAKGNLTAVFLRALVESWSVLPNKMPVNGAAGSIRGKAEAGAGRATQSL
jgi:hypothetical protein